MFFTHTNRHTHTQTDVFKIYVADVEKRQKNKFERKWLKKKISKKTKNHENESRNVVQNKSYFLYVNLCFRMFVCQYKLKKNVAYILAHTLEN